MLNVVPARFQCTQFPEVGPSEAEILKPFHGCRFAELGCGDGANLVYLARTYVANTIGFDIRSYTAWLRWQLSAQEKQRIEFIQDTALSMQRHLAPQSVDRIYSIFGAIGFSDPLPILLAAHHILAPDGRLVFVVRHPEWDRALFECGLRPTTQFLREGRNILLLPDIASAPVSQVSCYTYSIDSWLRLGKASGFEIDNVREIYAPLTTIEQHVYQVEHWQLLRLQHTPCTLIVALSLQ